MKERTGKLVCFGDGGHTIEFGGGSYLSGYSRPESFDDWERCPDGTPVLDKRPAIATDEGYHWSEEEKIPVLRYFNVFNAAQCEGLGAKFTARPDVPTFEHAPVEECERIAVGYPDGPTIEHGGYRAGYQPGVDRVVIPRPELFENREGYYATLFHELIHSTGHEKRLNRETLGKQCQSVPRVLRSYHFVVTRASNVRKCKIWRFATLGLTLVNPVEGVVVSKVGHRRLLRVHVPWRRSWGGFIDGVRRAGSAACDRRGGPKM